MSTGSGTTWAEATAPSSFSEENDNGSQPPDHDPVLVAGHAALIALFVMLLVLKWSIVNSGVIALVITALTAIFAFQTPLDGTLVALERGAWNSLEAVAVIWPAPLLYRICLHAGAFEAIKAGVTQIIRNHLFLIQLIG